MSHLEIFGELRSLELSRSTCPQSRFVSNLFLVSSEFLVSSCQNLSRPIREIWQHVKYLLFTSFNGRYTLVEAKLSHFRCKNSNFPLNYCKNKHCLDSFSTISRRESRLVPFCLDIFEGLKILKCLD